MKSNNFTIPADIFSLPIDFLSRGILSQLYQYPYSTNKELAEVFAISNKTIIRKLKELEDDGYIKKINDGTNCNGSRKYIMTNKVKVLDKLEKLSMPRRQNVLIDSIDVLDFDFTSEEANEIAGQFFHQKYGKI